MRLQSSIARASLRDSEDMKFIAVLGSVFLPASLVAVRVPVTESGSERLTIPRRFSMFLSSSSCPAQTCSQPTWASRSRLSYWWSSPASQDRTGLDGVRAFSEQESSITEAKADLSEKSSNMSPFTSVRVLGLVFILGLHKVSPPNNWRASLCHLLPEGGGANPTPFQLSQLQLLTRSLADHRKPSMTNMHPVRITKALQ